MLASAFVRRWRWWMVIAGLLAVIASVPGLERATVRAFPTSYYRSPTGYGAASIARGHALYDQHCAACHGADGRGPAAGHSETMSAMPTMMSADLTSDHIYAHTDGDLFWWISHGIDGVMPGFAGEIDDDGRWNLVDFIHANADATRLRDRPTNAGFPAPDFTADCPDGSTVSLHDLRGGVVHLVMTGAHSTERLKQLARSHIVHEVTTIVIAREDSPLKDEPFCATRGRSTRAAFAVYRGLDPAASEGTEFLLDASGQLRAIWHPGIAPAWTDETVLRQRIIDVREAAASARAAAPHAHMH
jgi:mono/diheme cytochrome c family protein